MLPNDRLTLLPSPSWKSAISTRLRELRQARASFGHVAWAWEVRESGSEQLAADNPPVPGSISSIGSPTIASAYRQRARRRLIVVIARAGRPLWPHCILVWIHQLGSAIRSRAHWVPPTSANRILDAVPPELVSNRTHTSTIQGATAGRRAQVPGSRSEVARPATGTPGSRPTLRSALVEITPSSSTLRANGEHPLELVVR